jgi:hypothetical protein
MKTLSLYATAVIGLFMGFLGTAEAALNAGVATAFTALETDALALIDLIWPVVTAVTVGFIIIQLFKKGAGKAV